MPPRTKVVARRGKSETASQPVKRRTTKAEVKEAQHGAYFISGNDKKGLQFVGSGCSVFDEVLGGGYVLGRMTNIVGDKSSGKTLLAIEACANFNATYPTGNIQYAETEAAFDQDYAAALGIPIDVVTFSENIVTVEDFYRDLIAMVDKSKGKPGLYILDSLDALSDEAEQKREIGDGSFGANKAKKLGELFRRLTAKLEQSNIALIIVSQLRDKIGVTFGETKTRSGGKALDFYASQIIWLAEIGKIKKTIEGKERIIGVDVKAKCKKNKVGMAWRECQYPILFGYGIDDLTASVEFLLESDPKLLEKEVGMTKNGYKVRISNIRNKGGDEVRELRAKLTVLVRQEWQRIESMFLPKASKY